METAVYESINLPLKKTIKSTFSEYRDLIEIIQFTENVATKIHRITNEAELFAIIAQEFEGSKYNSTILTLTDNKAELEIASSSLFLSEKLKNAERSTQLRLKDYKIDLNKSSIYRHVAREGKTLHVRVSKIIDELLRNSIVRAVSKILGYDNKFCILTPIYQNGEIIGVLAVSSPTLPELFIPSVKNLAQHISVVLELAQESEKRKKAEKILRINEEKLNYLYASMREGVCLHKIIYDKRGSAIDYVILDVNPAYEKITGLEREVAIGARASKLYGTGKPPYLEKYAKVAETGNFTSFETYFPPMDKHFHISVFSPKKGKFVTVFTDISEQNKAAEVLRESEVKYRTLVRNIPGMVYRGRADWSTEIISNSEDICGYSQEEFDSGKINWLDIIHPDDKDKALAEGSQLQLKPNQLIQEYRIIAKEGSIHWVRDQKLSHFEGGVFKGVDGIVFDITKQKRVEDQLQLRQKMDSIGTLAGGIAHDFNNILAIILGNLEILNARSIKLAPVQKECIKNIMVATRRATDLMVKLQSLSNAEVVEKNSIDLYETAKEVFSLIEETTNRVIEKRLDFKPGQYYVRANPSELHQVMLNLATNSIEAIEEKGTKPGDYIRIGAKEYTAVENDRTGLPAGQYIHIFFEDTGRGMSDDVKMKAFEPLFTTKTLTDKKGQGLGLAMVYSIVTRENSGHIDIESTEVKGTTFHVYLPKASKQEQETIPKEDQKTAKGCETILVVDDESMLREAVRTMLEEKGYTVLDAANGEEAMRVYSNQKDTIDLILLDLNMPKMSGQMVLEEISMMKPDAKVIVSSGFGVDQKALPYAKASLKKPYKISDLTKAIRSVLDSCK